MTVENNQTIFDAISNIMTNVDIQKDNIDAGKAGKYDAFTIDSVLQKIRPLLAANKLIMSIKHKLVESQYIDVESIYGKKTKHNVIIETFIEMKHVSGENLEFQAIGEGSDNGDKAISKAQTDSYKKIILQMFAISDGDDKDKTANDKDEEIKNVSKKTYNNKTEHKNLVENISDKKEISLKEQIKLEEFDLEEDLNKEGNRRGIIKFKNGAKRYANYKPEYQKYSSNIGTTETPVYINFKELSRESIIQAVKK